MAVGTLNQGYPLLQYEGAAPVRYLLVTWVHVARKDNASYEAPLGPDLRRRTPDPCKYEPRAPMETCQVPLSEVRALAGSRDREDPDTSKGPVMTHVQALPYAPRSGKNPPWLVARNVSQRAKPDVRPMRLCSLSIYCGDDVPPATTLTGDVPSQHLMRPVQSTGRRRKGHPADGVPDRSVSEQCARAERRTVPITPSTRSFPCTLRIRRSRASGHKKIAPASNIGGSKRYILYVLGPTCRGPAPLCMPLQL
jgi:hypothetical protein